MIPGMLKAASRYCFYIGKIVSLFAIIQLRHYHITGLLL